MGQVVSGSDRVISAAGRSRLRGTTFVELMVAVSVVGVALMVMLTQISISFRETSINENRAFAYRKAMAILAEIQNGVERGDIADAQALDGMVDVLGYNVQLTTLADENGEAFAPDHPMSGNVLRRGDWVWSRVVQVEQPEGQERLRYVRVQVFHLREDGTWELMAVVGGLVSLPVRAFPSTKHYDVYVIAISEAPSMWLPVASVRAMMETARIEMQTIENGLKLRLHWITKLGYGRDPAYMPFFNAELPATEAAPWVYWYPSLMEGGGLLYVPELISGRLRTESGVFNDWDASLNPLPHSIADRFNHCMRLPDARALFDARVAQGLENPDEPPLQLLLEDLSTNPDRYRNAMFVNLHGPALPLPPLRNYSDAAKDPAGHPGVRVVMHPERLWNERSSSNVYASRPPRFRVHAYKTDPDTGPAVLTDPITIQLRGADMTTRVNQDLTTTVAGKTVLRTMQIYRLPGGIDTATGLASGGSRDYRPLERAPAKAVASARYEMCYEVGFTGGSDPYTWIKLYNTPLTAPVAGTGGLASSERLYGMEYIPSPVGSAQEFSVDLSTAGGGPKNTARWVIQLPPTLLDPGYDRGFGANADRRVDMVTRIGDDMTTGVMWPTANQPHNRSVTYTWWAKDASAVPATERYQWQGDPRHDPYLDNSASGISYPNGYNWDFDDLRESLYDASVKWPCLDRDRLQDGFGNGVIVDAPRLLQLWRSGLQEAGAIWVNPTGAVAQSMVTGGEIAQAGGYPGAPPAAVRLHGSIVGASEPTAVDTLSPPGSSSGVLQGRQVVIGTGADPFWTVDWLGELCPDDLYSRYLRVGNLPCGDVPGTFHREPRGESVVPRLPAGTDFGFGCGGMLGPAGSVAALDSGVLGSTFFPSEEDPTSEGSVTEQAQEIAAATGDQLPETFPAGWPFALGRRYPGALPYFDYTTDYPKSVATLLEEDYTASSRGLTAAGLLALEGPASGGTAFLQLNGFTPSAALQHESSSLTALMLGLRGFFRAGESGVPGRVTQVPQIEILQPAEGSTVADPATMLLRWRAAFVRFDGEPYTSGYSSGFTEPEADLVYSVLFSRDQGTTWCYAANGEPAIPGERPTNPDLLYTDGGIGNESLALPTPESIYPGAEYLFRVECYHKVRKLHYSSHQVRVLLTR